MRLLIDSCVTRAVVIALRQHHFDVEWVAEWDRDPGDHVILEHAYAHQRVLVTCDKDFGTLIYRDHHFHGGVLRFAGNMTGADQAENALKVLAQHAVELQNGYVVTVDDNNRIRVTPSTTKH